MSEVEFIVYGLYGFCTFIKDCSDCCCMKTVDNKEKKPNEGNDYDYKYMRDITDMER